MSVQKHIPYKHIQVHFEKWNKQKLAITKSYKYMKIFADFHIYLAQLNYYRKKNRRHYKVNSFLLLFYLFLTLTFSLSLPFSPMYLSVYVFECHIWCHIQITIMYKRFVIWKEKTFFSQWSKKETRIDFHCTVFFLSFLSFNITICFNLSINNYK